MVATSNYVKCKDLKSSKTLSSTIKTKPQNKTVAGVLSKELLLRGVCLCVVGNVLQLLLHRFVQIVRSFVFLSHATDNQNEEDDETSENKKRTDNNRLKQKENQIKLVLPND